jgi:hypothetical protein
MNRLLNLLLPALAAALPAQHDPHWVVPSRTVLAPRGTTPVRLVSVRAAVKIVESAATTTLDVELHNPAATHAGGRPSCCRSPTARS